MGWIQIASVCSPGILAFLFEKEEGNGKRISWNRGKVKRNEVKSKINKNDWMKNQNEIYKGTEKYRKEEKEKRELE